MSTEYIVIFDFPGDPGVRAMVDEDGQLAIFRTVRAASTEIGSLRMDVARIVELGDEHLPVSPPPPTPEKEQGDHE